MVLGENKLFKLKLWWPAFQEELFIGPLLIQYFLKNRQIWAIYNLFPVLCEATDWFPASPCTLIEMAQLISVFWLRPLCVSYLSGSLRNEP